MLYGRAILSKEETIIQSLHGQNSMALLPQGLLGTTWKGSKVLYSFFSPRKNDFYKRDESSPSEKECMLPTNS